jgi:hypothetical protein
LDNFNINNKKAFILKKVLKMNCKNGDWGLGIGDWAQSPIPNPQSPIPNPHLLMITILFIIFFIKN